MEELKIKFGGPSRTRTDPVKQAIDEARQNHTDFSDLITDSGSSVDCEFVKTRIIYFDEVNTALTSPEKEALKGKLKLSLANIYRNHFVYHCLYRHG